MTDRLHTYSNNSPIVIERLKHLPVGGRMKDIPPHLWHDSFVRTGTKKTGGPNLRLLRLDPAKPSNTITAYVFNKFAHPCEDRFITPREAARIQQFPDNHVFEGPITSVQLQIGNAVPVGLAQAVASHVSQAMRSRHDFSDHPNAISLFAGAGGLDIGFKKYFNVVSANELVKVFSDTLRSNFPDTNIVQGDLSDFTAADLNPAGAKIDLVFGGPPCQPFSAAGKHGGVDDPRGAMVGEFLRIVDEFRPLYFIMENVPGLVSNAKGGALKFIKEHAAAIGYATEEFILTATDYGVPQNRRRLFVIGRLDPAEPPLGIPPVTHSAHIGQTDLLLLPCKTVEDAFAGLPSAQKRSR